MPSWPTSAPAARRSEEVIEHGFQARQDPSDFVGQHRPLLHDGQEQEEHPGKMEIKKYDPVVRKHVVYKEGKIK
jgi:hypothetical protein